MATHNYIPRNDSKFNSWVINLLNYIALHVADWSLPPNLLMALNLTLDKWKTAFAASENAATRTKATVQIKNDVRKEFETEIRAAVKSYITYNPAVTNGDRDNMELPIHDTTPTPVPPPSERPVVEIDFSQLQQHTLKVKPIAGVKPSNAHGFEIWRVIGDALPTDDAQYLYAGFSTKSPFLLKYPLTERGKTVYYRAHWVNAKNESGPWSELVSAIIA